MAWARVRADGSMEYSFLVKRKCLMRCLLLPLQDMPIMLPVMVPRDGTSGSALVSTFRRLLFCDNECTLYRSDYVRPNPAKRTSE